MDGWTFPFVSFIIISRMLKNRGKGSMNETILLIEDNESIIMGLVSSDRRTIYVFSGKNKERSTGSSCQQAGGSCAS